MKSAGKKARSTPEFKEDQEVVYPLQGVGKIVAIEEKPFKKEMLLYYIIYIEVSDMTVMIFIAGYTSFNLLLRSLVV